MSWTCFPLDETETVDTDGDGVGDNGDVFPLNPEESFDTDGDGLGNAADLDDDGDGVLDVDDGFALDQPGWPHGYRWRRPAERV